MSLETYDPLQSGADTDKSKQVDYSEQKADSLLAGVIHCFWTLKTKKPLREDFIYTILPDACIDIVFDITGAATPIIMTPSVAIETINLGKTFHYVGVRFKPGVLAGGIDIKDIIGNQRDLAGALKDQVKVPENALRSSQTQREHYGILAKFAHELLRAHMVERNQFIENIVRGMQYGLTVNEIAEKSGYSSRQLRRKVFTQTGYSPVQLRRIIRFQSVLASGEYRLKFADQSHLIREFKAVTGVSYAAFARNYSHVRKIQS